jgi:pyruvate dehydrogenase E1 component beta subunit
MREISFQKALDEAVAEEMRRDARVITLGTDFTGDPVKEFGPARVRFTPISEAVVTGIGLGAAGSGYRPIVNWRMVTFSFVAMDQIVNQASKIRYMFGGQADFPVTYRCSTGGGIGLAAQHSQSPYSMWMHLAGLKIILPSTPADAKGLLKSAIRDENPVIFIEHESLYGARGEVPDEDEHLVEFGVARVAREGTDVTIVGISRMAVTAERAAQTLAADHGIEAEVIDPRTLRPLDLDTILESVRKTNRCVIVEEGWPHGGVGANLAALIGEQAFDYLDAPVQRVTGADVPMPYSKPLEDIAYPHEPQVVAAALATLGREEGAAA